MEQEVFDGIGIIQEKLEKVSKKNKSYWKYKIAMEDDPAVIKIFNFFDYEAGSKVKSGDKVKLYWYEKEGDAGYGEQLFRNVRSIFAVDKDGKPLNFDHRTQTDEESEYDATHSTEIEEPKVNGGGRLSYNEGARIGMLFKCAVEVAIAENKTTKDDIKSKFNMLETLLKELEE